MRETASVRESQSVRELQSSPRPESSIQTVHLRESKRAAIAQTMMHRKSTECIRDQQHRLGEMIEWVVQTYPEYVQRGTVVITNEERQDPSLFYIERNKRDFLYNKLDVNIIIGFVASKKVKKLKEAKDKKAKERQAVTNPKKKDYVYFFETIRKYHDSILYWVEVKKVSLPGSYHVVMKSFLDNYKKEYQGTKKNQVKLMRQSLILFHFHSCVLFVVGSLVEVMFLLCVFDDAVELHGALNQH